MPMRPIHRLVDLGQRKDDPIEGPALSEVDEQFLHRHALAWSADHRPK